MAKKQYVTKHELSKELYHYRETGEITESLGKMIMEIADGVARKSNFYMYTWLDDMKNEAICRTIRYLHNIDPDGNPFSYISQICYNVFRETINKEKKKTSMKDYLYNYWVENRSYETEDTSNDVINYETILK